MKENIKKHRFNFQKIIESVEKKYFKKENLPVKVGDTIRCGLVITEGNKERTQFYEGIVISQRKRNKGLNWNLTVRRIMQGIGIERVFLYHSPKLASLLIRSSARVRRSKLYFLRKLSGKASRLQQQFD